MPQSSPAGEEPSTKDREQGHSARVEVTRPGQVTRRESVADHVQTGDPAEVTGVPGATVSGAVAGRCRGSSWIQPRHDPAITIIGGSPEWISFPGPECSISGSNGAQNRDRRSRDSLRRSQPADSDQPDWAS